MWKAVQPQEISISRTDCVESDQDLAVRKLSKMPSVRVRRNTATVAALVPAERLGSQSTAVAGSSRDQDESQQDVGVSAAASQSLHGKNDSSEGDVVLGPPVMLWNAGHAGQGE